MKDAKSLAAVCTLSPGRCRVRGHHSEWGGRDEGRRWRVTKSAEHSEDGTCRRITVTANIHMGLWEMRVNQMDFFAPKIRRSAKRYAGVLIKVEGVKVVQVEGSWWSDLELIKKKESVPLYGFIQWCWNRSCRQSVMDHLSVTVWKTSGRAKIGC